MTAMTPTSAVAPAYLAAPLRWEPFTALMLAPHRLGAPESARAFSRPYRDVASRLDGWQRRGLVRTDVAPAIYVHEYTQDGLSVHGIVGLLDLTRRTDKSEERALLPHEGVYPRQVAQLADRMGKMKVNPAPILLVHRGPQAVRSIVAEIRKGRPAYEFEDMGGQAHRIWAISDASRRGEVQDGLADSRPVIADGHHRYAAYLRLQERNPGTSWDRGLAMLVDHDDTPLHLGAIHRIVPDTDLSVLRAAVEARRHSLVAASEAEALQALGPRTLVVTDGSQWSTLHLRHPDRRAAVEVLHEEILPGLPERSRRVGYQHSLADTLDSSRPGRDLAIVLPAVDLDQVARTVGRARLLPEKATSFQPKPTVGVLMRRLDE